MTNTFHCRAEVCIPCGAASDAIQRTPAASWGCDRSELLEINHKEGGGGKELRGTGHKFYREIAKLRRAVDDLELLCRPCNAIHYLELKYGPLPFRVVWSAPDAN